MKKTAFVMALCLAFAVSGPSYAQKLTILHTNDTHSHIDPERGGKEKGMGGVVERAAFIDSVRCADGRKNVLLLDAGDWDQGSSYFTILNGDLEVSLVNAMKYDAFSLGNHEFDNGIDELTRRVKNIKGDVLCANYDFSAFELGKYVKPYAIYRRGGFKIGVIGLLCNVRTVIPTAVAEKLAFQDPAEQVCKWAEYLREKKGCDIVIALSHLGYREDMEMAAKTHGLDIVVGGHSHTELPEPSIVEDLDGRPVTIVQDYRWGLYVGQFDIRK